MSPNRIRSPWPRPWTTAPAAEVERVRASARALLAQLPARVTCVLEQPRGSFVRRDATGYVDFVSPLPCPFNYGSIPGEPAADGDELDAILIGGPKLAVGRVVERDVYGIAAFLDEGLIDHKLIVSSSQPTRAAFVGVELFMRSYAVGKRCLQCARRRPGNTMYCGVVRSSSAVSCSR